MSRSTFIHVIQNFNHRVVIVLLGLIFQVGVILLLTLVALQPQLSLTQLDAVAGQPGLCRVVRIPPLTDAWMQNLQPGTLIRVLPDPLSQKVPSCHQNTHAIQGITINTAIPNEIIIDNTALTFNSIDIALTSFLTIIFTVAGAAIFLRAQDRPTAHVAYALFCSVALMCSLFNFHGLHSIWVGLLSFIVLMMTSGLSTTFVCLFPHPQSQRLRTRSRSFLPYLPLLVGIAISLMGLLTFIVLPSIRRELFFATLLYNFSCIIVVVWVLFWGIRALTHNEQQIARMVMIGVTFLLIITVLSLGFTPPDPRTSHGFFPADPFTHQSILPLLPFPLVVLPIICDYALFRHQLLGVTSLLSRQAMRVLLWILLASVFIIPTTILLHSSGSNGFRLTQDLYDYLFAGLMAMSLWLFPLVWNKVRDVGDHVFYHDFYQYNRSLSEMSTELTNLQGLEAISSFLLPRLAQLLNTSDVVLFIRAISQNEMRYRHEDESETTHSWHIYRIDGHEGLSASQLVSIADQALNVCTERSNEPLLIEDTLLVALYAESTISGFLCLSPKKNLEPYDRQDKSFLTTLAAQLSVLEANNRYLVQAQEQAQQMTALSHRVVFAQEAERRHLALDLHDDVLQEAMLLVRQLSDASTMSDVADVMPLARSVVTNLRRTCLALRPSLLDELGLAEALRWLANQTMQMSGRKFQIELRYLGSITQRFPVPVELALYRVAQEALNNIVKHAQATHVILCLRFTQQGRITLTILDNGQGFKPGRLPIESLGLVGMHERMGAVGGHIHLRTSPGRGVIIRATYQSNETSTHLVPTMTMLDLVNVDHEAPLAGLQQKRA
ncbi:sensor histidine kinase [Tengunoibacter tsumagoiensis]|uniref:histidine kinase n=1 Tax=Tengunoibacter tsumagoiensis TaxID=2014871 RepID=A0A401ZW32_9CHLR|nr:sensor histidine kinase [Tengunoibacter tsumagoiensis]GCE10980.1 hypothetical protein KTT_08390 [Tengunoibacter tsumagoiensis]